MSRPRLCAGAPVASRLRSDNAADRTATEANAACGAMAGARQGPLPGQVVATIQSGTMPDLRT
jgi:hypothetical protein